jgi:hypothetical protein
MQRDAWYWRRAWSNPPPGCLWRLWRSASTLTEPFRPDGNVFCWWGSRNVLSNPWMCSQQYYNHFDGTPRPVNVWSQLLRRLVGMPSQCLIPSWQWCIQVYTPNPLRHYWRLPVTEIHLADDIAIGSTLPIIELALLCWEISLEVWLQVINMLIIVQIYSKIISPGYFNLQYSTFQFEIAWFNQTSFGFTQICLSHIVHTCWSSSFTYMSAPGKMTFRNA